MSTPSTNLDQCKHAVYRKQRLPMFAGNPLIEALPYMASDEEAITYLSKAPDFSSEEKNYSDPERIVLINSLLDFTVPFPRHLELLRALDSMLRLGYVKRAPRTKEHSQTFQELYRLRSSKQFFRSTEYSRASQISSSLIGLSGMGKTTTVRRWCANLPEVIYHPSLHVYQVPYLHIETPSGGASLKALALSILQRLDSVVPGASYCSRVGRGDRISADVLMLEAATAMHTHSVGILILDEVQNLLNSVKGSDVVMSELTSACNMLGVPILFIGTNKASKLLSKDFRQARRSSGFGIEPWDRLQQGTLDEPNDWDDFLQVLWSYQLTKNPVAFDRDLSNLMFDCCQGVIDIAIKLFAAVQVAAIHDRSEQITKDLIQKVYQTQFKLTHPMLDALRVGDLRALARFDDIAPIDFQQVLSSISSKSRPSLTRPVSPSPLVTQHTSDDDEPQSPVNPSTNVFEIGKTESSPARKRPGRTKTKSAKAVTTEQTYNASDYRAALSDISGSSTNALQRLQAMGHAPSLESVIRI